MLLTAQRNAWLMFSNVYTNVNSLVLASSPVVNCEEAILSLHLQIEWLSHLKTGEIPEIPLKKLAVIRESRIFDFNCFYLAMKHYSVLPSQFHLSIMKYLPTKINLHCPPEIFEEKLRKFLHCKHIL